MKAHDKGKGTVSASKPANVVETEADSVPGGQENSGRRRTSKYFPAEKQKVNDGQENKDGQANELPAKRKVQNDSKSVAQKAVDVGESDEDDVKDLASPVKSGGKSRGGRCATKGPANGRGKGGDIDKSDEDDVEDLESSVKSGGGGRGGRGASTGSTSGRGRGGGRGGFMNFGERKDPPHKGEKEVPEGAPDCLTGLTFVISGTLDSLEREEAEDLIKRHGGRITGSVSKKTNYLLCDEDIGGRKSSKAKELGTKFLTEDGLFDMIRASNHGKAPLKGQLNKSAVTDAPSLPKKSLDELALLNTILWCLAYILHVMSGLPIEAALAKCPSASVPSAKKGGQLLQHSSLPWTEKYRPKVPNEITGNQSLVKQLHDWLAQWDRQFLGTGSKGKGKKQNDPGAKKAVLLSGTPGIGKTTSAKLVSQMLGFQTIEVNASDSRGKADANISKGIGGSNANSIKELVSNEALGVNMDRSKHPKTVLIMDEVDGMSAGDRGGIADLIGSIKISKIPIICICNDRYSQKLKSLVNYCLLLSYHKPTKQQMAKRLMQVGNAEGLQVNEIALEELAERVNGDMRMALNQLQYMSLSMSIINYNDIRQRLLSSSKDEDISPFTAVDKLFGFNGGKLRMDERIDLSMSDLDLVPLLVQENYINYKPSSIGKDDSGIKRMNLIARAAESIGDGDIVNVQIRRYRQWQLSQTSALSSCIIPAALLHGQRETLEQLLDCAFLANEAIDFWRKKGKKGVVFKVDFSRAYDLVEWSILLRLLKVMGFGDKWISWIEYCISSASISVLVNGSPAEEFQMGKGLRQGCSLSPLLFNIVGELLNLMLIKAADQGLFEGFRIGRIDNLFHLTHLQFADDLILFCRDSPTQILNIRRVLRVFSLMSGLHLNLSKSNLFGVNSEDDILKEWAYEVNQRLNSLMAKFLWREEPTKKRIHWVNWKTVCQPYEEGGLGVLDLSLVNRVLLGKWVWKFANEKKSQWKKMLCCKHNVSNLSLKISKAVSHQDSWIWRGILNNYEKNDEIGDCLRSNSKIQVGNGRLIEFWNDVWVNDSTLKNQFPRIFSLSTNKWGKVVEFGCFENNCWVWNIQLRRNLCDWELEQWITLMPLIDNIVLIDSVDDFLAWSGKGDGLLSVKSCRLTLSCRSGGNYQWNKWVWSGLAPPRVETFLWQISHKKMVVRVELKKRGVPLEDVLCPLCHKYEETIQHLFISCSVAGEMWNRFLRLWDISTVLSQDPSSLLCSWSYLMAHSSIWNFIPGVVFVADLPVGDPTLADRISIKSPKQKKDHCWFPPPHDFFKFNVDGAGRLILESDCKTAVDWILMPFSAPSFFSNLVGDIGALVSAREITVRLIPRSCNWEANKLAKEGIG
ncbi:Replication factor C subunit 1 [Hibiscus syriacus]|uniref:Replication factor C subunit 1 n=1 Tax=Hibiscus syriacus TaxID=106335 RepID=A0A6A3D2K8_HIBSY|nr:Replication factor C subunit 1 [Hibiscus syriacus]